MARRPQESTPHPPGRQKAAHARLTATPTNPPVSSSRSPHHPAPPTRQNGNTDK